MAPNETPKDGGIATEAPPAQPAPEPTAGQIVRSGGRSLPETQPLPQGRPAGAIGVQQIGIAPTSFEEGWRLAQLMAKSSLVPKNFINKAEDVLVAIQMGIEIGFAPMQALQSIAVINGRPSVWGDGFLALLMSTPLYQDHDEYYEVKGERRDGLTPEDMKVDTTCGVCTFERKGKGRPVTRRFSIADAKKAGLWTKEGPWVNYPQRMLMMRARSWAGRDTFPDILRGIRTAEEAMDEPPAPGPTIDTAPVQRISETSTAAAEPEPLVAGNGDTQAALPGVEVVIGPVAVKDVEQFMGGFLITLGNGQKVETSNGADAMDLDKFKGTKKQIKLVCTQAGEVLTVQSFSIVD